ncbi:hypothetical protein Taro_007963 [Colocasia esculenta]|uniref:Uncharacterized protein n=1 Tax=Colocasia esculenta TaxID=4460 RepID=A0A843U5G4_COLES|nr:hypothetical protein [Colocasia esculenta]
MDAAKEQPAVSLLLREKFSCLLFCSRRDSSIVSKSVSILDLSGKDKSSTKPPRRLSTPFKPASSSPHPARLGNITPISEHRVRKLDTQNNTGTPASDISKSVNRKKYSRLSEVSYWLSQIKLSESASKHSISLGFFKLAMESGCEPLQRVRKELKSYAVRHNILELGDPAREVLRSYDILGEVEGAQNSQDSSHTHEEGTKSSDDSSSCSSIARSGNLKPKSVNTEASGAAEAITKGSNQTKFSAGANRASYTRNPVTPGSFRDGIGNAQKKTPKARNLDPKKERGQAKTMVKKSASETVVTLTPSPEETAHEDKENRDHQLVEESNSTVEV